MPKFVKLAELMNYQAQALVQEFNNGRYPADNYTIPLKDGFYMGNFGGNYYICKKEATTEKEKVAI